MILANEFQASYEAIAATESGDAGDFEESQAWRVTRWLLISTLAMAVLLLFVWQLRKIGKK